MTRSLTAAEFGALLRELAQPTALIEAAVLLGCLAAAWLLVRLLRGARAVPGSIWFGTASSMACSSPYWRCCARWPRAGP